MPAVDKQTVHTAAVAPEQVAPHTSSHHPRPRGRTKRDESRKAEKGTRSMGQNRLFSPAGSVILESNSRKSWRLEGGSSPEKVYCHEVRTFSLLPLECPPPVLLLPPSSLHSLLREEHIRSAEVPEGQHQRYEKVEGRAETRDKGHSRRVEEHRQPFSTEG